MVIAQGRESHGNILIFDQQLHDDHADSVFIVSFQGPPYPVDHGRFGIHQMLMNKCIGRAGQSLRSILCDLRLFLNCHRRYLPYSYLHNIAVLLSDILYDIEDFMFGHNTH